jgi:hypothetical protein
VTHMSASAETLPAIRSAIADEAWEAAAFVDMVRARSLAARPFDERSIAFCGALSRMLLEVPGARADPQVVALGYWLRPTSVERMRQGFRRREGDSLIFVPRGCVLHVTPANVDTMFVYSWVLAMLTGNSSVVRVSTRVTDTTTRLLSAVATVLSDVSFESVRRRSYLVHTSHDDRVARALSEIADVRVLWGGDATIAYFRQFPLPPRGRDVTFPNRHSLAIIDAEAVRLATDDEIAALAGRFFSDAYSFDQGACSSPRLIVWRSLGRSDVDGSRRRFRAALEEVIRRRAYGVETGVAIAKVVHSQRAAARVDGARIVTSSRAATWVELPTMTAYDRDSCGGGLFFDVVSEDLTADLTVFVNSTDQTAVCYGLDDETLRGLARGLNGRGIDRFVSIGRALEFGSVWDGYDLLAEFVRRVDVGA